MTPEQINQIRQIVREELARTFTGYTFSKNIQILDGRNIQVGRGIGTKIGTESDQKLAFFNLTPITQPTAVGDSAGISAGAGTAVDHLATFVSGVGTTAYRIGDIIRALKNLGIIAK